MAYKLHDLRHVADHLPEIALPETQKPPEGMGEATRVGVSGILTYDASGDAGEATGDDIGVIVMPPPTEWWFIRALATRPDVLGGGEIADVECGWYRWASRWVWDRALQRWLWNAETDTANMKRGLEPYEFPKAAGGHPLHNWTQISKEYTVGMNNEQRWIDNSEIWDRHIYPGEILLLNSRLGTVTPTGYLSTYLDLDIVRYPMPSRLLNDARRFKGRMDIATVIEAMIGATPDPGRR